MFYLLISKLECWFLFSNDIMLFDIILTASLGSLVSIIALSGANNLDLLRTESLYPVCNKNEMSVTFSWNAHGHKSKIPLLLPQFFI